jgi:hypothetical protein
MKIRVKQRMVWARLGREFIDQKKEYARTRCRRPIDQEEEKLDHEAGGLEEMERHDSGRR